MTAINLNEELKKAFGSSFRQKVTTSRKTGKANRKHFRIDIEADDLFVEPSAKEINQAFGDMIAAVAKRQVQRIDKQVSEATLERRKRYDRDRQSRSYKRRYSGGRTGETPPLRNAGRQSQYGNDSGRFAESIVARLRRRSTGASAGTINVAANRLDPRTFGNAAQFRRWIETLRQEAPFFAGKLTANERVQWERGLQTLLDATIDTSLASLKAKRRRLRDIQRRILAQIGRTLIGGAL